MSAFDLVSGVLETVFRHQVRPAIGLRFKLKSWNIEPQGQFSFPPWISPELTRKLDLRHRLAEMNGPVNVPKDIVRHEAYRRIFVPYLSVPFERADAGNTGIALDTAYPFMDMRVLTYLMAIPPFPWFIDKYIVRQSMVGKLPESVLRRPKQGVIGHPALELMKRQDIPPVSDITAADSLSEFIDLSELNRAITEEIQPEHQYLLLLAISLNYWLKSH